MNVLHLTTHLNTGGITVYILRLVKPLQKLGFESFIVSSGGEWEKQFQTSGAQIFKLPIRTKSELSPKLYLQLSALKQIVQQRLPGNLVAGDYKYGRIRLLAQMRQKQCPRGAK